MLAQAPPGKAGPENLVFWFQGSFYWASLILSSCWLNDWACFLFHILPCSLIEAGSWLFLLGSCLMGSYRKSHLNSSLTYTYGFAALSLPVCFPPCLNSLLTQRSFSVSSRTHSILWLLSWCSSSFWIQLLEVYFPTCSYYLTRKLLGV